MQPVSKKSLSEIYRSVQRNGWSFARDSLVYRQILAHKAELQRFAASWQGMPVDRYLRDKGRYRQRRYSVLENTGYGWELLAPEPHFQSSSYNRLHGGFSRHYYPVTIPTLNSRAFKNLLDWNLGLLHLSKHHAWRVQAHQFRITSVNTEPGKPTPEGQHQDGADFVFIMLLARENIEGGETTLLRNNEIVAEFTMEECGDAVLLDDQQLQHKVSPITLIDPSKPAWRDVLVLTFHAL